MAPKTTYKFEPKSLPGGEKLPEVCVDDILMSLKYFVDEGTSHLIIKSQDVCKQCQYKPCLYFCPVRVYTSQADGQTQVGYQACVECGSCRVGCPYGNIEWKLPRGGYGVAYKFG
jgi:ferredoxin like protein